MGDAPRPDARTLWACRLAVVLALAAQTCLLADQARHQSATYDETAYLRVGARWWRTGDASEISRMGSPVTFLKLGQAPTLWALDRLGRGGWIDDPVAHLPELLPAIRLGTLWIAGAALLVAAGWAGRVHGPRAMALAAALFALSPNLLAHGALATMELPLVAASAGAFAAFHAFLRTGRRRWLLATSALAGLAWSVKFTAVLIPPILAAAWLVDLRLARGDRPGWWMSFRRVAVGITCLVLGMVAVDLALTGFAMIPASLNRGDHPALTARLPRFAAHWVGSLAGRSWPQDWVAFGLQVAHQRRGGPSYLLGEIRESGWWYYYLVALAVKAPLALGWLVLARLGSRRGSREAAIRERSWYPVLLVAAFLLLSALGSKRNYGVRYLLPAAVPAIVWLSALAERGRWARAAGWAGVAGMGLAVASIHPHELSFFNRAAGGPIGGRRILSDSNLDWGQGLRDLARLQADRPELRDLTLFYFGDVDPKVYGIAGECYAFDANRLPPGLPSTFRVGTAYVAVSASLRWGPWGPPGYFGPLQASEPILDTPDATIAIYRAPPAPLEARTGPGYDESAPAPANPVP